MPRARRHARAKSLHVFERVGQEREGGGKGEGGEENEQVLTVRKTVGHEIEEQVLSVLMRVAKTKNKMKYRKIEKKNQV